MLVPQQLTTPEVTTGKIWQWDRVLLRNVDLESLVDPANPIPNETDAARVSRARTALLNHSHNQVTNTAKAIEEITGEVVPYLEEALGLQFQGIPEIRTVSPFRYKREVMLHNETDREKRLLVGARRNKITVPRDYFPRQFPSLDLIIVPDQYTPEDDDSSTNREPMYWDRDCLELCVCDMLGDTLVRQARGEWGQGHAKTMKSIGEDALTTLTSFFAAISQVVGEGIAVRHKKSWLTHIMADKLEYIWPTTQLVDKYAGILQLVPTHSLAQIAMVDDVKYIRRDLVQMAFNDSHPEHWRKKLVFEGGI